MPACPWLSHTHVHTVRDSLNLSPSHIIIKSLSHDQSVCSKIEKSEFRYQSTLCPDYQLLITAFFKHLLTLKFRLELIFAGS